MIIIIYTFRAMPMFFAKILSAIHGASGSPGFSWAWTTMAGRRVGQPQFLQPTLDPGNQDSINGAPLRCGKRKGDGQPGIASFHRTMGPGAGSVGRRAFSLAKAWGNSTRNANPSSGYTTATEPFRNPYRTGRDWSGTGPHLLSSGGQNGAFHRIWAVSALVLVRWVVSWSVMSAN